MTSLHGPRHLTAALALGLLLTTVFGVSAYQDDTSPHDRATPSAAAVPRLAASNMDQYTLYIPHMVRSPVLELENGSFEESWWRKTLTGQEFGEIFVPREWTAFWNADSSEWGRPEMRVIPNLPPYLDPPRVYSGTQALSWFTFFRKGDAGVLQQVAAEPGTRYRATGYAHVWFSQGDDASVSEWNDSGTWRRIPNGDPGMTSMIGIDPTGGANPWSTDVIWTTANIYDQFALLSVEATAQAPTITVLIRATTLYPFKHCDAYWDEVVLSAIP